MKTQRNRTLLRPSSPLIALVLASALLALPSYAQNLYLKGGKLVDPETRTIREEPLLIVDGRIQDPGELPKGFQTNFKGEIVDVEGRWIIPGLVDLHTHAAINTGPGGVSEFLGTEILARRMLYNGVTAFLDLFNDENYILELRDRQRRDGIPATADIFAAGACLTSTDGHGTEYPIPARIMDSPADAKRQVDKLAAKMPDVIKIIYHNMTEQDLTWREFMPTIDKKTFRAAVQAAKRHGIPTVVHIGSWQDARDAVEVGADAVTHLPHQTEVPADVVKLFAESGTWIIPSLPDISFMDDPELRSSELVRSSTTQAVLDAYTTFAATENGAYMSRGMNASEPRLFKSLKALIDAGARIATGTDSGNTLTVHGFSMHRQLALMVEAGLDPWVALATSTVHAGDFLKRDYGLSPGDEGSVVVLDGSPIEDITQTQKIHLVVHHGVVLDRDELKAKPNEFWADPPRPSPLD